MKPPSTNTVQQVQKFLQEMQLAFLYLLEKHCVINSPAPGYEPMTDTGKDCAEIFNVHKLALFSTYDRTHQHKNNTKPNLTPRNAHDISAHSISNNNPYQPTSRYTYDISDHKLILTAPTEVKNKPPRFTSRHL
jgi:hypothetical protein